MAKEETVQERAVREQEERDAVQPTPTQAENDAAKLAVAGTGDTDDGKKSKDATAAKPSSATYQTRGASAS